MSGTSPISSNTTSSTPALARAASHFLPWLLATAPLWWAWGRSRPLLDAHRRRLVDALIVLGLVPAFAGLRFYPHYFVLAGFALGLGAAPAVAGWLEQPLERPRPREAGVFLAATLALLLGFQLANAWLYLGEARVYRETDPVYREVAERLAADPCFAGSRLFVWGWAPNFYYEAGLRGARPASRFVVMAQSGLTGYVSGRDGRAEAGSRPIPQHWDWLLQDLARSRATYVLDTAPAALHGWNRHPVDAYPRLDRYLGEHYEPIDSVRRIAIFRRRGCAEPIRDHP